jgi:twinkle protein
VSPPDLKVKPVLHRTHQPLVVVLDDKMEAACRKVGAKHVVVGSQVNLLDSDGKVRSNIDFFGDYVILIPEGGEDLRDTIAINLGDERCRWAYWPADEDALGLAIDSARPMWTDEVSTIDDVPEPGEVVSYKSGFPELDQHGFRIVLPAFMPIIGPYGSGKSVFLRQLLMNLWQRHQWKFLLTSFEEKVKPRYLRDLRRHIIGRPVNVWTDADVAKADGEIRQCAVFLRRKRNATLDLPRLINRIEFAVRVHGVRVVAIDPVNEIDHQVPRGESKTDTWASSSCS